MRISELSKRSGVPLPTIKYYLREGLLPAGRATAATSAEYDEEHVRRLRLIRALVDVGGLSIAATQRVLDVAADPDVNRHELLGSAMYALGSRSPTPPPAGGDDDRERIASQTRAMITEVLAARGWSPHDDAPAWGQLVGALTALRELGFPPDAATLEPYVAAAERLAAHDLDLVAGVEGRVDLVEAAVTLTVLWESALIALHRLAQESEAARRYRD